MEATTDSSGPGMPELLAPAGAPEAAFAAFQFGADAVYLGLEQFSARAEAVNFTYDELSEVVAYAHSLRPARRVFVALNTLVTQNELAGAVRLLTRVAAIGPDAVIVQDLGLARVARQYFPELRLHASTQLAIHNAAGVRVLRELGFRRVTLARELSAEEVGHIVTACGADMEVEAFVHGALCYSYSGLCLYSSLLRGRSGNRGSCAYPCRDLFTFESRDGARPARTSDRSLSPDVEGRPPCRPLSGSGQSANGGASDGGCFPFSMKDLALPQEVSALKAAGVASLKIEGRMKGPLYVACTTAFYRGILDGTLSASDHAEAQEELKTVFSRPWTGLYVASRKRRDVIEPQTVGHRGTPVGVAALAVAADAYPASLRFTTSRPLERHDGLQVELPGWGRPFGFAVDSLQVAWSDRGKPRTREVFEAGAGIQVEVPLPREHPAIPAGVTVYLASSQAVKRKYKSSRPKPGQFRVRYGIDVTLEVEPDRVWAQAQLCRDLPGLERVCAVVELAGRFEGCRNPAGMTDAIRGSFDRLGDTSLQLVSLNVRNPQGLFVPVSILNALRRDLAVALEKELERRLAEREARVLVEVLAPNVEAPAVDMEQASAWQLKTDRLENLDRFEPEHWATVSELVVEIGRLSLPELQDGLAAAQENLGGRERIRLALPLITRRHEEAGLAKKLQALVRAGWNRWEASNLSAWQFLREAGGLAQEPAPDLGADWSVYVTNRAAAQQVLALGARQFVLSPEESWFDPAPLLAEFPDQAVVFVYGDVPLFVSENCPVAGLTGRCDAHGKCGDEELVLRSQGGERVRLVRNQCRAYTLMEPPLDRSAQISGYLRAGARTFRAEFMYRKHDPFTVLSIWRALRLKGR